MKKTFLTISLLCSQSLFAAPLIGYALDDLKENCGGIKRVAESAIEFRYSNTNQNEVLKVTNEIFNKKSDVEYKRIFKIIVADAYKQQIYKEKINIKAEKKAFVDRYVSVCEASYKGF